MTSLSTVATISGCDDDGLLCGSSAAVSMIDEEDDERTCLMSGPVWNRFPASRNCTWPALYSIVGPARGTVAVRSAPWTRPKNSESTCGSVDETYLSSLIEGMVPGLRRMFKSISRTPAGTITVMPGRPIKLRSAGLRAEREQLGLVYTQCFAHRGQMLRIISANEHEERPEHDRGLAWIDHR